MTAVIRFFQITTRCGCLHRNFSATSNLERLRSEWRTDRKPANTKVSDDANVVARKAFGGRHKSKAVCASHGKYLLESQGIEAPLQILDVVHSDAGRHIKENNILVKGAYIIVDATPLKTNIQIDKLFSSSDDTGASLEVNNHLSELFESSKLYARVTSRPGQVGNCDGVIVEGKELTNLIEKLKVYENPI